MTPTKIKLAGGQEVEFKSRGRLDKVHHVGENYTVVEYMAEGREDKHTTYARSFYAYDDTVACGLICDTFEQAVVCAIAHRYKKSYHQVATVTELVCAALNIKIG